LMGVDGPRKIMRGWRVIFLVGRPRAGASCRPKLHLFSPLSTSGKVASRYPEYVVTKLHCPPAGRDCPLGVDKYIVVAKVCLACLSL